MLRSLLVAGIIFSLIPACFFRPWIGILVWTWISYMSPHRLTYGFAYDFPFALIVSAATLAGLLTARDKGKIPPTGEVILLAALWLVFFLSTVLAAFYPDNAWAQLNKVSKILLMTFVTIMLIQTRERLTALFAVVAFSLGFFGLKGGIWSLATGGQDQVLGPSGSFLGGNTEIGLALNMNLPILFYLRRQVKRPIVRHLMLVTFLFSIIAIIITYSRGALLGLIAVLGFISLNTKARVFGIALLIIAIPLATAVLPERWLTRMGTIKTYEEDASAMGRIHTWILSTRIAMDRPFLGAGFRCLTEDTTLRYMPESPDRGFDAHNVFFQVLAEHGFTGLILFAALIATTLNSLRRIRRRTRRIRSLAWMNDYAQMLQGSLIAYVVSGFFLSLSYFDLFYLLVAATVVLRILLHQELKREQETSDVPAGVAAAVAST